MSSPLTWLLAWFAGVALGGIFFGGLWWTVGKAVAAKQPAAWIFVSFLVRTSTVLVGFYFVSAGRIDRLLLCLLGFVMARATVKRLTRSSVNVEHRQARQVGHAS